MNKLLVGCMDKYTPKFSKQVTEGTAKEVLEMVPDFLDERFKDSITSLSPDLKLTYLGYRRMSPMEEYSKIIVSNPKTTYDLARSDIYPIELHFEHEKVPFKTYLYLPFADLGNLIMFSNTPYAISPVLSDTVISPSDSEVFVRLLKNKLTFRSTTRNFIKNGERTIGHIIHTNIISINTAQIKDNIGKPLTSTSLYPLGEMGFKQTMRKYTGIVDYLVTLDEIPEDSPLRKLYTIYESTGEKPRGLKEYSYIGHTLKICIPIEHPIDAFIDNFIYGLLYTFDILPEHAMDANSTINGNDLASETKFWRLMLGRITYRNNYSVSGMIEEINTHYNIISGYIDSLVESKLKDNGIKVSNFFDLIHVIMSRYNEFLMNSKEYNSDINNRYMDILYYVMYDIIVGFNRVVLTLNKRVGKKTVTRKEVLKVFQNELSTRKIYSLVKSQAVNLCIQMADCVSIVKYLLYNGPLRRNTY